MLLGPVSGVFLNKFFVAVLEMKKVVYICQFYAYEGRWLTPLFWVNSASNFMKSSKGPKYPLLGSLQVLPPRLALQSQMPVSGGQIMLAEAPRTQLQGVHPSGLEDFKAKKPSCKWKRDEQEIHPWFMSVS